MGSCKNLAHWNHSFHSHLTWYPVFFTSWALLEVTIGSGCNLMASRYSSWVPLRHTSSHWRAVITDNCESLSTDMAGNILFHTRHHRERSRGADFGENSHPLLTSCSFPSIPFAGLILVIRNYKGRKIVSPLFFIVSAWVKLLCL